MPGEVNTTDAASVDRFFASQLSALAGQMTSGSRGWLAASSWLSVKTTRCVAWPLKYFMTELRNWFMSRSASFTTVASARTGCRKAPSHWLSKPAPPSPTERLIHSLSPKSSAIAIFHG